MTSKPRSAATLRSVADAAGVHTSSASRALDPAKRHLVGSEVADRVQAAARRLGYRRDDTAVSLRTGRSGLVGVILPDIVNPVFGPILSGIEAVLERRGYVAFTANGGTDERHQVEVARRLIARRVEALILATVCNDDPVVALCLAADMPTVLVNRAEARSRVPAVVSDDVRGMELAVEHLVGLGHRRIGHIAGPAHLSTGTLRREGFERAARAAGLRTSDAVATASSYTREAGRAATAALLDRHDLTAIVAANDLLALGVYQDLAARGLSCPEHLSVVGHNDMPLVDMVDPPLTTIRISHREMGEEAARLLLARIDGDMCPSPIVHVTRPVLVVRGSTRAPSRPDLGAVVTAQTQGADQNDPAAPRT